MLLAQFNCTERQLHYDSRKTCLNCDPCLHMFESVSIGFHSAFIHQPKKHNTTCGEHILSSICQDTKLWRTVHQTLYKCFLHVIQAQILMRNIFLCKNPSSVKCIRVLVMPGENRRGDRKQDEREREWHAAKGALAWTRTNWTKCRPQWHNFK